MARGAARDYMELFRICNPSLEPPFLRLLYESDTNVLNLALTELRLCMSTCCLVTEQALAANPWKWHYIVSTTRQEHIVRSTHRSLFEASQPTADIIKANLTAMKRVFPLKAIHLVNILYASLLLSAILDLATLFRCRPLTHPTLKLSYYLLPASFPRARKAQGLPPTRRIIYFLYINHIGGILGAVMSTRTSTGTVL